MFEEYEDTHSATHYNLCWKIGDEKLVSNFFLIKNGVGIYYLIICNASND